MSIELEILKNKKPILTYGKLKGVYFLIQFDKVVYVGKTKNLELRMRSHIKNKKLKFNNWHFIQIDNDTEVRDTEIFYIKKLTPKYNFKNCPNRLNIRKILFSKYLVSSYSIYKLSKETGLSEKLISNCFDLNKKTKKEHIEILKKILLKK